MPELLDTLQEYQQVTRVLRAFEVGGRITNMTVSTVHDPNDPQPGMSGSIWTADMDYPPQMIEAIKANLMERQKKIADDLKAVGVIVPVELMR